MPPRSTASLFLLTGLALSIGWGIRGNFGHEFGALLPGALAAMTGALLSGRADWNSRVAWFGFLGALGWSFGGSMSYMQVIAYTHSGHSGSILYGFASLFLIGFLWAAIGGAGTALPAIWNRRQLESLLPALAAVAVAWGVQSWVEARLGRDPAFRHEDPLYWYDTDWLAATTAPVAVGILAALRRRWDAGSSLVLYLSIGWWIGFLVLVNGLGLRMTPPRGDNWSGCLGMTLGLWIWMFHRGALPAVLASAVSGFAGGFGFATAALLESVELTSGLHTNWHSILEQTYGFLNGLGIALVFWLLRTRVPVVREDGTSTRWARLAPAAFVAVVLPWLNLRRDPEDWIRMKAIPESLYGIPSELWFHAAFALLAVAILCVLGRASTRTVELLPQSDRGRGQVLLLFLLGFMVLGNLAKALPGFQAERLVTEGVIHLNALVLTLGVVLVAVPSVEPRPHVDHWASLIRRVAGIGVVGFALSVAADWGVVRLIHGERPTGARGTHIRFGPSATATKAKPVSGTPHP
ncbi:MAG: hypothetical protein JNL10_21045 [Verrucomicrobiales bacterium]|nr:hypothetical protein [Verrucomicrobiales bacterium]